jgi:hypothetical protein
MAHDCNLNGWTGAAALCTFRATEAHSRRASMADITAADFTALCGHGPVASQIQTIEANRRGALSRFWMTVAGGGAGTLVLALLLGSVSPTLGVIAFLGGAMVTYIVASGPLHEAAGAIKLPTLQALAAQAGMTYTPAGFEPPVMGEAYPSIFSSFVNTATYSDLFYGQGADGRHFAIYEAILSQRTGRHTNILFNGQVYAFQRRRTQTGQVAVVPDQGIFNFFKPLGGFSRLPVDPDPEFDRQFEVYTTNVGDARAVLGSAALRMTLMQLRAGGKVFAYFGPTDVLVAIAGGNHFEPGSMFQSKSGEERVRLMFNDVCGSLDTVKRLLAVID